jgi:multidrug efflux pump subunit AcrB
LVTLRFHVGEDRETSILNTYNKLYSNQDRVPPVVSAWQVKPVEVDDVPMMVLALWSEDANKYSDYDLRRTAEEISTYIQGIPKTSEVNVVGGRPRAIRLILQPESLVARKTTAADILQALKVSNVLRAADRWVLSNESILLESGDVIRSLAQLRTTVINVVDGVPVLLQDVAEIIDGPAEQKSYHWIDFSPDHPVMPGMAENHPMVVVSVAKQRGSNAVSVARDVHAAIAELKATLLPAEMHIEILRDYGQTANEKVTNLTSSLAFAVVTVVIFIAVFLGWRSAVIVGLAVPVCYGVTLALDMMFGYTINRVTLFALILSLGLLVDDPITGVDNITRYLVKGTGDINKRIVDAIAEIRTPLLMSTLTIVLAFLPLAYITGMMGPYMAPMAFNVPISVIVSTIVAFIVTPWLASRLLAGQKIALVDDMDSSQPHSVPFASYQRWLRSVLDDRRKAKWVLWMVLVLFLASACLPMLRMVPLKLLPFDNKNEVQILIDLQENSTLETTAAVAKSIATEAVRLPEVMTVAAFIGEASPMDFNGMVRKYYQRRAPYLADLRLILVDKTARAHQSHAVVLRLRELLKGYNINGASIKVVEVPPGPPVLSTLVAEIHGTRLTSYADQQEAAKQLMARLQREPHVVEVDSTIQSEQQRWRFVVDKNKAALSGVSTGDINRMLAIANAGEVAGYMHLPREALPLPIELQTSYQDRIYPSDLERLQVKGLAGVVKQSTAQGLDSSPQPLVALGELGEFQRQLADQAIYRKDLRPVVYVMAELSGRTPAEVIADLSTDQMDPAESSAPQTASPWQSRTYLSSGGGVPWQVPEGITISWSGEGEWRITIDVFRDMGLAFAFALMAIFLVLRIQTASSALALIIMSAIPLTIIGIMPGFWLLNQVGERTIAGAPDPVLFTATAMIGMIALAGIVVRNSLILVEFITQSRAQGLPMKDALVQAGAIRMRPILLTAGTTLLGNIIITLDPVFSGLALAIMFGIISSTLFTLVVIPVVYMLVFDKPANLREKENV